MKKIILAVSASISIYKVCNLVRNLTKRKVDVHVLMTHTASKWINPVIFEALSNNKVLKENDYLQSGMEHIRIRDGASLIIVIPASANIIAHIAHGFANDIVTSTLLSFSGEKWLVPAMNPNMYNNPITQENIKTLEKHQFRIIKPIHAESVCGEVGKGNLASIETIEKDIIHFLKKVKE